MALSIRQKTFDALVARLQEITIANGYDFDIGERGVHLVPGAPQTVSAPALFVRREPEVVMNRVGDRFECVLPVFVDAIAEYREEDGTHDQAADLLLSNVERAAMSDPDTGVVEFSIVPAEGGAATRPSIQEVQNAVNFAEMLDGRVYCRVELRIMYQRHIRHPSYQSYSA